MIIYTIYKSVNTINGKVYIGFDSNWPNRLAIHKSNSKKVNYKFYRAIRKYGWDSFEWSVLYQSTDRQHTLKEMENHFICEYDSFKNGYNSTLGGEGVFGLYRIQSEEEKIKRIKSIKNTYKNNPELGLKVSARFKNKPLSEERKLLLRKPRKNPVKSLSDDHKKNLSISKIGKPQQKIECPHCNKIGGFPQMKQWHFDKCKFI